ncbi:MAG: hypothetical protein PHG91_00540 [Syntrophales bacterium]|nr:hypothetical protein [Syntrophales bacterium]MDD5231857.1 hypothetical protein [Syntrophales bacterium]MDD5532268.1 hypothetical protein [Syntrophales bacterium]
MAQLETNINKLRRKDPDLADRLTPPPPEAGWELVHSPSGDLTAGRNLPEGFYLIHSSMDPRREAAEWLACQDIPEKMIILLGMGLGYPLRELAENTDWDSILVVEDASLFRLALAGDDFSDLIRPGIEFLIGPDPEPIEKRISRMAGPFSICAFLPAFNAHREFFRRILDTCHMRLFELRISAKDDFSETVKILLDEIRK